MHKTSKTYLLIPCLLGLFLIQAQASAQEHLDDSSEVTTVQSVDNEVATPALTLEESQQFIEPALAELTEVIEPIAQAETNVTENAESLLQPETGILETIEPVSQSETSSIEITNPSEQEVNNDPVTESNSVAQHQDEIITNELEKGPVYPDQAPVYQSRSAWEPTTRKHHFTQTAGVKAEPKITSADLAIYQPGQSVSYDRTLEADGHRWISYIAYSGNRRYVAIEKLPDVISKPAYTTVHSQLTSQGIELSIDTNQVKDKSTILYAVWSDVNDQDDLKWYHADKQGRALAHYRHHLGYGTYHIHTYTNETGKMVVLDNKAITIEPPKMSYDIIKVNDSTVDIIVTVPPYIDKVQVPVWSAKNGQDDLKWYQTNKQRENTYKVTVSANNHKNDLGQYHVHIYGNSQLENDKMVGLGVTEGFKVNKITQTASKYTSPNARPLYQTNTYPVGQCTWGAKQIANWVNNSWGNAKDWIVNAQRDGFTVGDIPVVGAVAVFPNLYYKGYQYGHVGVITEVVSNTRIKMLESNVNGKTYVADHRGYFNPKTDPYLGGAVKYIYPPKAT